jgi:hypothetical protein
MVRPFPSIELQQNKKGDDDYNPAIRLFGRRFFADQTVSELLLELLLVATSPKVIGDCTLIPDELLPSVQLLRSWPARAPLKYAPKARLNLKLFVFLGASKLDTRHSTHKQHYRELIEAMTKKVSVFGAMDSREVLRTLENLFLGFQSVGGQRTWCAQAFLPISRSVIAGETLWNDTEARRDDVEEWSEVTERFLHFFSFGRHRFLARGGELLYLQLCNALRQEGSSVQTWLREAGIGCSPDESDPTKLHHSLGGALAGLFSTCPETVNKLADFLDSSVESMTALKTDFINPPDRRFASCGWCPEESWREGVLFAIEFRRLCEALVDPVERLELLEILCALQVLRSLCAQSARYAKQSGDPKSGAGPLSYVWAVSDPAGRHTAVKQISRRNVNAVQRMIYDALRHPSIRQGDSFPGGDDIYTEADTRYGHSLFVTVAKRIGLIVPKRGAGARFVFNDKLLRCLVLSIIRPGQRVTYDVFKRLLFGHYGIAVDDETIGRSCLWSGTSRLTTLGGAADGWLIDMLDASGMLIRLSDSCSLVNNPFGVGKGQA